ncbi:uncharacterized protein LOC113312722 [Papaver somniferum]|uniref:uncharacterized protein LOC113312722 n=1 Tax=Papaver somniferum TaxID=3469 RepID=UPI000E7004B1|nr:uncharacterized protein LOC113312722 [Papaver somniferum]
MKLFPQPITSPNRIEKYSPTLIRSIRSGNGRSKSRRRSSSSSSSRLSPMFSIRTTKRNNNGRNETTPEPSSPKVNCCGEIRVKRSSSNQTISKKIVKTNHTHNYNHNWIQKILFCKCSSIAKTMKKSRPVLGKWLVCLQIGCLKKRVEEVVEDDDNNDMESGKEDKTEESQDGHDDDKGEEISEPAAKVVSVPPKNALLLMRSRSESYYRPTSLAHLFWGSPSEEEEEDEVTEQNVNPRWSKDTKIEEKDLGVSEEIKSPRDKIGDELKKTRKVFDQFSSRELRRSKSDPARISEEVINDSENSLWKRRRLGFEFEEEEENS